MAPAGVGVEELKTEKFWIAVLAEFMGTLLLILVACGSCNKQVPKLPYSGVLTTLQPPARLQTPDKGGPNLGRLDTGSPAALSQDANMPMVLLGQTAVNAATIRISLAFGFSVATIVWIIAHYSGGHINPAITLAFVATRKISVLRYVFMCAASFKHSLLFLFYYQTCSTRVRTRVHFCRTWTWTWTWGERTRIWTRTWYPWTWTWTRTLEFFSASPLSSPFVT